MKRVTFARKVVVWVSDARVAGLFSKVLSRLGWTVTIPRPSAKTSLHDVIIVCDDRNEPRIQGSSYKSISVNCSLHGENELSLIIQLLSKLYGRLKELGVGVDVGLEKITISVVFNSTLIYWSTIPISRVESIKEALCELAGEHSGIVVGIGYSPSTFKTSFKLYSSLRDCGLRAVLVNEFRSNIPEAYGVKGLEEVNKYDDVVAAVQIALRAFENIN